MRNFPKRLATASDIRNCRDLVLNGTFKPSQLLNAMEKLEKQNYADCPILESDNHTVTVVYCPEIEVGHDVLIDDAEKEVSAIEHITDEETGQAIKTVVTFTATVASGAEVLRRPVTPNIYDRLGMSKEEFDSIKEEVSNNE